MTRSRWLPAVAAGIAAWLAASSLIARAGELQDAQQLFRQGQQARALELVNSHLVSRPDDAQARFLKGLILTAQNQSAEAIGVFQSLIEDYPELPEPYNNLAVLYAAQGQYDQARQSLEMAIRAHPGYATAHENLGDLYARMAGQSYDKALQLDKDNASARAKLALLRDMLRQGESQSRRPSGNGTPSPAQ